MKVKDGKKENIDKKISPLKELKKSEKNSLKKEDLSLENDFEYPTTLNQELEEHLKKDKNRFFGGCGG